MGSRSAPPLAPSADYIGAKQASENLYGFNTQLDASRVNQFSPYGSQTWQRNSSFDEAGYNEALKNYENRNSLYYAANPDVKAAGMDAGAHWAKYGQHENRQGAYFDAPDKDKFTRNTWDYKVNLSPDQQKLFDANTGAQLQLSQLLGGLAGRTTDSLGKPLNLSGVPKLATDPFQFYGKGADAAYSQATRYLKPQLEQQQQGMEARLAEQGFVPGTPAYARAMTDFQTSQNNAFGDARDRATQFGAQWGSTAFGNQNNARTQGIAELLMQRQLPLNELNALRSGTQAQMPNNPAQYSTPNFNPVDIAGLTGQQYQNDLAQYNANQAGKTDWGGMLLQGGMGLAGLPVAGGGSLGGNMLGGLFSGLGSDPYSRIAGGKNFMGPMPG